MRKTLFVLAAVIVATVLGSGCNSDEERQKEIAAAATKAAEAAYAKGKADSEQAAARAQQEAAQQAAQQAAAADEAARQAAQQAAAADEVARAAIRQEKSALRKNPTKFLPVSDLKVHDRGFIFSYRQLVQMTVLNRSKYPVTNISGEVDWISGNGTKIGSTTFSLAGSLPAGDTKTFATSDGSLTSSTLQGQAATQVVRFTSVDVVE